MEKSPELVHLVSDWFAAASRGDTSLIAKHVSDSQSARLVGSDPDEWLTGGSVFDQTRDARRAQVHGLG